MSMQFHLKVFAGTDPGKIRDTNEDSVLAVTRSSEPGHVRGLLVVADGVGGHQAGEIASQLAVDVLKESFADYLKQTDKNELSSQKREEILLGIEEKLRTTVIEANRSVYRYAREHVDDAGNLASTVTSAVIYDDVAIIANVGDSRAYILSDEELELITHDHSFVAELVRNGQLPPDAVYTHPQRSMITRALGHQSDIEVDIFRKKLFPGDYIMLCSDGLWEMIRDPKEIVRCMLNADDLDMATKWLIESANRQGGRDNIGVALGKID